MKCTLCGFEFDEKAPDAGCRGCGLFGKCGLVKCPNCDYETVPVPESLSENNRAGETSGIGRFFKKRRKKNATDR